MAQEIKIQEIASQLTTGSKVSDVDFFWLYAASGQQMKIPAPTVRAYLIQGAALSDALYKQAVGLVVETSETTVEMEPNKLYRWIPTVTHLNITFKKGDPDIINEYMMEFKVGSGEVNISFPPGVRWVAEPDFVENSTYQVSIVNGLAVAGEWEQTS